MHAVVSAIDKHGISSDQFLEVYDKQITQLALSPPATVDWPACILWARHRGSMRTEKNSNVFLTMISTPALIKNGLALEMCAKEQDRNLGERIASWLLIHMSHDN